MVNLIARTRIASGLGQVVPGKYKVLTTEKPIYNMDECDSFNGEVFQDKTGTLCCAAPQKSGGMWYCRRFVSRGGKAEQQPSRGGRDSQQKPDGGGKAEQPPYPDGRGYDANFQPPQTLILGMQPPVAIGLAAVAAAVLFALVSRRAQPSVVMAAPVAAREARG
jgi:hypothetical protein